MLYAALVSFLALPVLVALIDVSAGLVAHHRGVVDLEGSSIDDFEVLVPIYGRMQYLENVDYLSRYGSKVVLCTTNRESPEFERELQQVAHTHGFRIFRATVEGPVSCTRGRATSGTIRDRIVRDAHQVLTAPWVVCIDADTVTAQPLELLVGAMAAQNFDLVSVRLVPSNGGTLLARFQAHEYRVAMLLRRIMPWMVSGACHAGRREVHRRAMNNHSLFFQGNDIELGILADRMGYRVGHVPLEVPTTVPEQFHPWLRQRLAWAGGEVRLFLANPHIMLRHPFFWMYGAVITIGLFPLRWEALVSSGRVLLAVPAFYVLISLYLHRGQRNWSLLLMPLYTIFSSLVITPLGLIFYLKMVVADRNAGFIRLREGRAPRARDRCTERVRPRGA